MRFERNWRLHFGFRLDLFDCLREDLQISINQLSNENSGANIGWYCLRYVLYKMGCSIGLGQCKVTFIGAVIWTSSNGQHASQTLTMGHMH